MSQEICPQCGADQTNKNWFVGRRRSDGFHKAVCSACQVREVVIDSRNPPKNPGPGKIISQKLVRETLRYNIWEETSIIGFSAEVLSEGDDPIEAVAMAQDINEHCKPQPVTVQLAYTPAGEYIGSESMAKYLCDEMDIVPELQPGATVCSIGFCESKQKWYGWSHRAIYGFGIGDEVSEGDCTASSGWTDEYLAEHPEEDMSLPVGFKAKTLDDAKKMAIVFAESVG